MNIKELERISFLEISSWSGLGPNPGFGGYSITEDGQIFRFSSNFIPKDEQSEENIEEVGKLSPEEVLAFKKYLIDEEKVFTTNYEEPMIFDAGTTVVVNIDSQKKEIKNESSSFGGELGKKIGEIMEKDKKVVEMMSKISSEEAYEKVVKDYGLEELRRSEEKLYDRVERKIKELVKN